MFSQVPDRAACPVPADRAPAPVWGPGAAVREPTVAEIRALVAEADAARALFLGPDPHDREEQRYSAMYAAEARAGSLANVRALLAALDAAEEAGTA